MRSKAKDKLAMLVVCILLGVILAIQFKTFENLELNLHGNQRNQQIAIEYKRLKKEKEKMLNEIESLEKKVHGYEEGESNKDIFLKNMYKDLEKYKMLGGYEDVKGEGVVLQIDDPPTELQFGDEKSIVVGHYGFLLEIISLLNAVGVEAISINDQRYTTFTEIVPAGNLLEVNGISLGTPIIIKAIGNPEDIENALRIKGGIIWLIQEGYDLQTQIKQEKEIFIPKYSKVNDFKYAKPQSINKDKH